MIAFTPIVVTAREPVTTTGVCPSTFPFRISHLEGEVRTPWEPSRSDSEVLAIALDLLDEALGGVDFAGAYLKGVHFRDLAPGALREALALVIAAGESPFEAKLEALYAQLADVAYPDWTPVLASKAPILSIPVTVREFTVGATRILGSVYQGGVAPRTMSLVDFTSPNAGAGLLGNATLTPGQLASVTLGLWGSSSDVAVEVQLRAYGQEIR